MNVSFRPPPTPETDTAGRERGGTIGILVSVMAPRCCGSYRGCCVLLAAPFQFVCFSTLLRRTAVARCAASLFVDETTTNQRRDRPKLPLFRLRAFLLHAPCLHAGQPKLKDFRATDNMSRGGRGDSEVTANIEDAHNATYLHCLCVELFAVGARIVRRTFMCTS